MKEGKEKALEYLRHYRAVLENEKIIREQMFAIERLMSASRTAVLSAAPTHSGSSRYEDFIVNQISKKDELKVRLAVLTSQKSVFRMIMDNLTKRERIVIERFYFSETRKGAAEDLMEKLGFEKSHIYRIKDSALFHIADIISTFEEEGYPPVSVKSKKKTNARA